MSISLILLNISLIKITGMLFMAFVFIKQYSYAATPPPGTQAGMCWSEPNVQLRIDLGNANFKDTKKGNQAVVFAVSGKILEGFCYTQSAPLSVGYTLGKVSDTHPPSSLNSGYYKMNEDLDYSILTQGISKLIQFNGKENKENPITTGRETPYATLTTGAGSTQQLTLILRRDLIGGGVIIPEGTELGLFYIYANAGKPSTTPFVTLITGGVIPAPTICNINDGNIIDVDFGDIISSQLTTSSNLATLSVDKQLTYSCNSALTQNINVRLASTSSDFDGNAIKTSNKDVGVVMLQNGKPVPPDGAGFSTTLKDGKGSDTVTFVPVKSSSAKIATGAFSASSTLIITAA